MAKQSNLKTLYSDALKHMKQGDFESAKSILNRLNRKAKNSPEVAFQLAICGLQLGHPYQADQHIMRAAKIAPKVSDVWTFGLFTKTAFLGSDEARKWIKLAENVATPEILAKLKKLRSITAKEPKIPNAAKSAVELASTQLHGKNYGLAKTTLSDAVMRYPNVGKLWYLNAILCVETQDLNKAVAHIKRACKCEPLVLENHVLAAEIYAVEGKFAKSFYTYCEARQLEPDNPKILFSQARMLNETASPLDPKTMLLAYKFRGKAEGTRLAMLSRIYEKENNFHKAYDCLLYTSPSPRDA